MKQHAVTVEEFDEWLSKEDWREFARSVGNGSDKRLRINSAGICRVIDHGELLYDGDSKEIAVQIYNERR